MPIFAAVALWALFLFLLTKAEGEISPPLLFTEGDGDMKIAPDPGDMPDRRSRRAQSEEAATQAYLNQRRLGNTKKAAELGAAMGKILMETPLPSPPPSIEADEYHTQLRVLCAFAVNRALEEYAPGPIVAQSALAAFYDALQSISPDFYEAISESAAFSLYMYLYRSEAAGPMAFATAFAEVCGHRGSYEVGLYAYREAYERARGMINAVSFR